MGAEVPGEEVPGAAGQRMRRQAFQRKGQGASSVGRRQQRHTPPRLVEDRPGPADVGCGMTLPEVLPDPMAERLSLVRAHLDERAWRLLLGAEAKVLVRGGIKAVSAACGAHPDTVAQGVRELDYPDPIPGRVRRPGAGRPGVASTDPTSSPPAGNGNLPETPDRWNVHDFEDKKLGKVASYGVYDITADTGWVNVGTDADPGQFAVESIRRWWNRHGCQHLSQCHQIVDHR